MKQVLSLLLFINSVFVFSQDKTMVIDTVSDGGCKEALYSQYQKKFELLNKNYVYANSSEKNIIKEINSKAQVGFLETISNNEFLCDAAMLTYLKGLFDEILDKNKIGGDTFKILLSKDSEVNAYNFGEGTVVVNFGLFLSIENEDELVFVLSHEIGHQYLNHVKKNIEEYAKLSTSKDIINKTKEIEKQKYNKASVANDLLKNIVYQNYAKRRKKEIEADSIGLLFYKKTFRNPKAGIRLLEKLDISDEEKDSLTIADYRGIFDENVFKVKEKYFQEEESLFKKYDSEKRINTDSLKSHPACSTRIQLIKKYENNKFDNENFARSSTFDAIKKNSVCQNLLNLYSEKQYGICLYETLKLYKNDKENQFYKTMIRQNLLEIQKARTNYTINRYVPSYDNKNNTASLNRFASFVNNIKMSDFDILLTNFKP